MRLEARVDSRLVERLSGGGGREPERLQFFFHPHHAWEFSVYTSKYVPEPAPREIRFGKLRETGMYGFTELKVRQVLYTITNMGVSRRTVQRLSED